MNKIEYVKNDLKDLIKMLKSLSDDYEELLTEWDNLTDEEFDRKTEQIAYKYKEYGIDNNLRRKNMNEEIWHSIFKDYLSDYQAIETLYKDDIIDLETKTNLMIKLLEEIIINFETEIAE